MEPEATVTRNQYLGTHGGGIKNYMREIKFRFYDPQENQMCSSGLEVDLGGNLAVFMGENECPIMQYTGLKDKNGKEIYEGDVVVYVEDVIVETIDGHNRYEPEGNIGTVKYNNCSYFIDGKEFEFYAYGEQNFVWEELEVIGNIYENPELLTTI